MRLPRPHHSTVVAYLALFVAMGGTAVAATGGTFTLGRHNNATRTTGLTNTKHGPALKLATRGRSTPNLSVSNTARIKNLNAGEVDGLTSTQLLARAGAHGLPANFIPVSASPNAKANGGAFSAALGRTQAAATSASFNEVVLLGPGRYDVGSRLFKIPSTATVVGAGPQVTTVITTGGGITTTSPDLRDFSIVANSPGLAGLDVTQTLSGTHLLDMDITSTSQPNSDAGIINESQKSEVTADDVSLEVSGEAFANPELGPVLFRDGSITASSLGLYSGQDDPSDYPLIVGSALSSALAQSVSATGQHYCSGDYSIGSAGSFTAVPDGEC